MSTEIKAPSFPESVADGTIATWHKQPGEAVSRDDLLADIETDKVVLEVLAPNDGVLKEIVKGEGDTVLSEEVIAIFEAGAVASAPAAAEAPAAAAPEAAPAATKEAILSPAARKIADEKGLDASQITGTGKGGRVTKEDALKAASAPKAAAPAPAAAAPKVDASAPVFTGERVEKRVPMTRLRKRVAERLVEAQQMTAMLTTFNEVNMKPIMDLRKQYQDLFEKKHGVRMGFMGFFVKACVEALKRQPVVNASIDGDDVVYHGYQDIGVAVSSDRGLVVPVLRDTDTMGLADIENGIREYGLKARDGKLGIEDMTGGTFTISNGGVFGSLLSTPILNMPQSAILGMHKIQERPMAVNGKVEILPMMYLALSYDHRLLDGKEAVTFLVTIKDLLEDPARFLLEV
ncbi:2-oxoglutarate dehydrogenase complex dihydrolipoyllysine-residue succinyltransferase [Aestuariirhabdus litorea]|uniref:Dihydrolipoyllysine-residue succinyltransferase component of 2-oxoglutarate dehydrogenase complex n=1 Tax=Aestuariirhabdus litorea TaxID=2528527 RepID=A0A3P3VW48_9GAMM|nr:2-oxoglutarate dehydrogenase complex dihydrolipoyllysine-residue succinyltransferase [Aestuariirhabdus litorea]RRJ84953.1 2-oxoglutarate dehydrogenase complex dihydrolipoyllysine-residue succinyltransferase [Aestuariirhabdus litorea]RWW98178.1 2-oxoglutarate dehydrogenase complex dihydrolipoyllysine-residue succinyltransferase [Endozoicomonadaceae bacterium GTF-13]